jgi:hypothetical protein
MRGKGALILLALLSFSVPTFSAEVSLNITHQSQLDTGCPSGNYCCGIAAVNMGTSYVWGVAPTTQYLKNGYIFLKLSSCCTLGTKQGTTLEEQLSVAKQVGNALNSYSAVLSFDQIKSAINAKNPVSVAIIYGKIALANRCTSFTGKHSVLVIGYNNDQGYWVVNDPLCKTGSGRKKIPSAEFRAAAEAISGSTGQAYTVVIKR